MRLGSIPCTDDAMRNGTDHTAPAPSRPTQMTPPSTLPRPSSISLPSSSIADLSTASDSQQTPKGAAPSTSPFVPASLTEKRLGDPDQTDPPLKIDLPLPIAPIAIGREFVKAEKSFMRPNSSKMSATESDLADSVNASLLSSGSRSRGPTVLAGVRKEVKRSSSRQPMRRDSETGYEGGEERHGQANDFVDEDDGNSDDAAPSSRSRPQISIPSGRLPSHQSSSNSPSLTSATTNAKLPDLSSTHRNRNPSSSSHQHPGPLPSHHHSSASRNQYPNGFRSQQPRRQQQQASSITSTRSAEATQHPFPTPGMKLGPDGLFDDWQSVEEKRLDEDARKEKHWKRWGPYCSERQWVSLLLSPYSSVTCVGSTDTYALSGHCSRGLFGKR